MATAAQTFAVTYPVFAFLVAFLLPYLAAALWVRRDAGRRGSGRASAWAVGVLLAGPAFPFVVGAYLLARPEGGTETPPDRIDRVLRNVAVASVLSFVVVAVASPPDPLTQAYALAVALPVLVVVAVLLAYRDVLGSVR